VSIAFWSRFCPVDFNLDLAACVTFCPSMTSDARFRPVFKASRPKVLAPLFNKGTADCGDTSLQKEKGVVSRMKQRHNPDARAYHEYYLNQAGRGYPVYVGTRYQRGHGLGSILFCPVDFNLDLAACVTFCPSMTSDARFRPVFKAWRPKVLAPPFNKGMAESKYHSSEDAWW
jgi:hypothetical protein